MRHLRHTLPTAMRCPRPRRTTTRPTKVVVVVVVVAAVAAWQNQRRVWAKPGGTTRA